MKPDKKRIGGRIQAIRISLGYTLEEFGENLTPPASKSNVSRWEKGKNIPNKARLLSIAKLGGVSTEYLLLGEKKERDQEYYIEKLEVENLELKERIRQYEKVFEDVESLLNSRKNS
ncbi:helix-turn-helix domain-containing protein [Candidatus Enterococcus courvalinii]|uniref:Helix-turn-helix transcriptional regulator n=1 Tax=Candidatus Enterococcus courvalinii TaxID=2815329 RepID=A0ABS3HYJ1_9ENTE|nr:helix-turn-helix transcriptional regulator [Enterococcus sp. MSG2901]MBO0481533.1 helix-turn-helix transcriptional regulator [Enterococcus sp. MSG2901]